MSRKQELLDSIQVILDETKEFSSFKHLFSNDVAKKKIAALRKVAKQVLLNLALSEIKEIAFPKGKALKDPMGHKKGCLVAVRPCDEKYEGKTYLGFLIGDLALSSSISIEDDKILCDWSFYNPLIFIPSLGETVLGCGSWWGEINNEDDLKQITDNDIENVWYVKALAQMSS